MLCDATTGVCMLLSRLWQHTAARLYECARYCGSGRWHGYAGARCGCKRGGAVTLVVDAAWRAGLRRRHAATRGGDLCDMPDELPTASPLQLAPMWVSRATSWAPHTRCGASGIVLNTHAT